MNAYKNTQVNSTKSQGQITKLLQQHGILESRFTNMPDRFILEFRVVENDIVKPIAIRIVVSFQTYDSFVKQEKDINRLYRVLFYHLKAKFIAIDSGLTEFMEEFMPHLVVTDKQGNTATMAQTLLPQYKTALGSGEQKEFKLLN